MDEYPNPDEEFELMYGDEFDLIQSEEYPDEIVRPQIPKRRLFETSTSAVEKPNENNSEKIISVTSLDKVNDSVAVPLDEVDRPRKRTVEELFGDIDDILYEDDVTYRKKRKSSLDDDNAVIEHILELRRLTKERNNPIITFNKGRDDMSHYKYNISYEVPKYSFTTITKCNGERIYVRCHSEQFMKEELHNFGKKSNFAGCMGETFKQVWKEAELLVNKQLDALKEDESEVMAIDASNLPCENENSAQLWVDLYKPQRYLELLSDETTNRILLKWFKLWDKVVFNKAPKLKLKNETTKPHNQQEFYMNLDEHGRPQYKIVLLCGPPGLGKTTLAHLVAKHAGYNVVEVNASDDRNTESFKRMLENATQMSSVIDQNKRPNCIVFDEIDGAPSSSIDFLIKYVTGTTKRKKKNSEAPSLLKRPIVCICNDVYVPSLRPLRQIAFVISFPPTAGIRLAERLHEIARRERIKADIGALLALCEKTGNDIRSCLSLLHFLKSLNKPVTLSYVNKTNIGQKDMQKGLFAVWQDIFHFKHSKREASVGVKENDADNVFKNRMQKVLQVVQAFGDHERLIQGIFENYLTLQLKDSSLDGVSKALEWFCYTDIVNHHIYSLQSYTLSSYIQYAFVIWHFLFATSMSQKLSYPSVGYEVKTKTTKQIGLVTEILKGMRPNVRAFTSAQPLKLDTLPILYDIITPQFRPVNIHLFTKQDKDNLCAIVARMVDYNLNYIQERVPAGNYIYVMEPNIEEIVTYKDIKKRRMIPYTIKQLLSREIDLEKMRQFEKGKDAGTENDKTGMETSKPNHLQNLKPKSVKPKTSGMVTRDFFGRIITKPSSAGKTEANFKYDVWYQYKEGYNNAVRKRIKISTLK